MVSTYLSLLFVRNNQVFAIGLFVTSVFSFLCIVNTRGFAVLQPLCWLLLLTAVLAKDYISDLLEKHNKGYILQLCHTIFPNGLK